MAKTDIYQQSQIVLWKMLVWAVLSTVVLFPLKTSGGDIKGMPKVKERYESTFKAKAGDPVVKIPCPIRASPDPLFDWYKGGELIGATWERYSMKKSILRIKAVQEDDSGQFTCNAVNGFGKANVTLLLIVIGEHEEDGDLSPPVLYEVWPDTPIHRRLGDSLTLTCRAKGIPAPTVAWYKDGLLIAEERNDYHMNNLGSAESGLYTCIASSKLGSTSSNFSLHVGPAQKDPTLTSQPTELEVSEAFNTTVVEGGSTALQCTVRATAQQPTVMWLKEFSKESGEEGAPGGGIRAPNGTYELNGRWYHSLDSVGGIIRRGDNTYLSKLTIENAGSHHAGAYACMGMNVNGYSFKVIHLTVLRQEQGLARPSDTTVGEKEKNVNWLFLIIPAVVVVVVVIVVIVCQLRKTPPDKPMGVTPPAPVLKGDDASALAPLNPEVRPHPLPRPPDLVYQEVSGYTPSSTRGPHSSHYSEQYPSPYPESYPESYPDPAYSDPYPGDRGPTRASDHSYARLNHPSHSTHPSHPSLASHNSHPSHNSHTSHASSSPHLPPPYPHTHGHTHSHAHTHRHPQYFVHYNL